MSLFISERLPEFGNCLTVPSNNRLGRSLSELSASLRDGDADHDIDIISPDETSKDPYYDRTHYSHYVTNNDIPNYSIDENHGSSFNSLHLPNIYNGHNRNNVDENFDENPCFAIDLSSPNTSGSSVCLDLSPSITLPSIAKDNGLSSGCSNTIHNNTRSTYTSTTVSDARMHNAPPRGHHHRSLKNRLSGPRLSISLSSSSSTGETEPHSAGNLLSTPTPVITAGYVLNMFIVCISIIYKYIYWMYFYYI